MKLEELMIGDWVFNTYHEKNVQITPYDFFTHGHYPDGTQYITVSHSVVSGQDFEPIPITPEILKKNGFELIELKPEGWLWHEFLVHDYRNYIFIQFEKDCEEVRYCEIRYRNKIYSNLKIIQYVHELQHIIKVYKINKEIML